MRNDHHNARRGDHNYTTPGRTARHAFLIGAFAAAALLAGCGQMTAEVPDPLTPPVEDATTIEWSTAVIGYDAEPADAVATTSVDALILRGSGADIWYDRDAFVFRYTELVGDGSIEVQLRDFDGAHDWSKAGVMIREGLDPDARNVLLHTTPTQGSVLQSREAVGGMTNNAGGKDPAGRPGVWMRLTRSGDRFTGELSFDGTDWSLVGAYELPFDETLQIGLAVTSHAEGALATAEFTNPRLTRRAGGQPTLPTPQPQPQPEPDPTPAPEPSPAPEPIPTLPPRGLIDLPPATLFVATNGNDSNSGRSVDAPLRTLTRAAALVQPGDVVYLRGGTYPLQVKFSRSGTASAPITWASYPGEWAILDGSNQEPAVSNHRVWVDGASWNVFANFEVRNGPRVGIFVVNANDNVFHGLVSHGNHGSGIQNYSGNRNRYEYIVSYDNFDVVHVDGESGQDADGIGLSSGDGNVLYRVVTYANSDDGIDAWKSTNTLIDGAVAFDNGRGTHGNGNGIKAGGGVDNYTTVQNSIAFHNKAVGITNNSGRHMWFFNNTSFDNGGPAFVAGPTIVLRNNIGLGSRLSISGADSSHNTWDLGITDARFVSTNPDDAQFLSLRSDSPAVDAGVNVGLASTDGAPDLGALAYLDTIADLLGPIGFDVGTVAAQAIDGLLAQARY